MNLYPAFANWLDQQEEHEVTADHLLLLQRLNLGWCSYAYQGAPGVDPRRPFGNGDLERDIADILGWTLETPATDGPPALSQAQSFECVRLFGELLICLQILTSTLSLQPGRYVRAAKWSHGAYTRWSCLLGEGNEDITERNRAKVSDIADQLSNPERQKDWPPFLKTRQS